MLKRLPLVIFVLLIVLLLEFVLLHAGFAASPVPGSDIQVGTAQMVYPNPTSGQFTLHLQEDVYDHITLVNILGQTIIDSEIPVHTEDMQFDLSAQPEGTYFYALYQQGVVRVTKKLMKQ